jgi:hypothetical protein
LDVEICFISLIYMPPILIANETGSFSAEKKGTSFFLSCNLFLRKLYYGQKDPIPQTTESAKALTMENTPLKIYFAGDLFDAKDLGGNLLLADAVETCSGGRYRILLPQDGECEVAERSSENIRDADFELLFDCDIILANFDGPDLDSGTVAEFLFAKMLDMPAVLLRTDFRCPAESSTSPDPWNLMCSGYPRTSSLVLHGMELWHKASSDGKTGEALVRAYHNCIAEKIIGELDKVFAMEKVFPVETMPLVYENTLRAVGGSLASVWPKEKINSLIREKHCKGIY